MNIEHLRSLLDRVRAGQTDVEEALESLRSLPYEDLGFAKLDHHRSLRTGRPEVVFCQGKTCEQISEIVVRLAAHENKVLATRASAEQFAAVSAELPSAVYHHAARIIVVPRSEPEAKPDAGGKYVSVVSAGTADSPVAEEAAITASEMGSEVRRIYDVGVAGLHRLLGYQREIAGSTAVVVVAGMEGALASVVGGLVPCPVVAVPTSVGYGASFGGLAALLTMLNSCASGVAVVNIDNGFGAGLFAHMIDRGAAPGPSASSAARSAKESSDGVRLGDESA